MNEDTLVKLALVRYALIPLQLLSFDEAYGKDCFEFNRYFISNKSKSIVSTVEFITKVESGKVGFSYKEKCKSILGFVNNLPFLDVSSFIDLSTYNPFDDFDKSEVDNYFLGQHIPEEFDAEDDEASLFYANSPEKYYKWYSALEDKSLLSLLRLYLDLIKTLP